MRTTRTLAAALAATAVIAAPAFAQGPPDGIPSDTNNPGTQYQPEGTPNSTDNPGTGQRPEGTPNGTDNPGTGARPAERPSRRQARALGREHCQEFRTNFRESRSAFGRCISAVARALRDDVSPARACRGQSRRREEGQRRSDFSACVQAAARAIRDHEQEQEQDGSAS